MAGSTYSSNLKIELMSTGENSGTWGTITNTNLGTALEQAVIGLGNPDFVADANLTISITNSNAAQAARALVLNVTSVFGSLTATRELVVPTIQKQYIVQNNTTGGQSITVKTSAGTGITVPNGRKAHLYVDGTNVIQMFDFVDINGGAIDNTPIGGSTPAAGTFTTATVTTGDITTVNATTVNATTVNATTVDATNVEVTNIKAKDGTAAVQIADSTGVVSVTAAPVLTALTASQAVFTNASKALVSNAITGTGNVVMSASPTLTGTVTAAAITASGTVTGNGNWVLGNADTDTITQGASYVNGTKLRSAKTATNTLALAAYDVDGAAYTDLVTLTASNTPTLALTSTGVGTINNMSVGATTASTGAFTTLAASSTITASTLTASQAVFTDGSKGLVSNAITGTGNVVMSTSPTLVTPALGTPSSVTLTNATGLPISTGVSGLGTGVATFLATPSSANLRSAVTDETGTGALVFATSPTLVTPNLGTPSTLVGTNITGTAAGLTAGNVTTNANLTGAVTSVGNATSLGSFTSAQLAAAVTNETGSGALVFATSPTLVTPALGTPSSATLTNATGLPISTGVSGLGTGVATALAVNVGTAGSPVVNGGVLGTPSSGTLTNATGLPIATGVSGLGTGVATFLATPSSANLAAAVTNETGTGALVFATSPTLVTPALGTPSSGVVTNLTGTASININGTVGATTPNTGNFTVLTENASPAVVQTDIGTAPNEIPLNQYLGEMAYMNAESVVIQPQASAVPNGIGDMVFQLTSDTSLEIKVKGSDGTVRSVTLTLA